MERDGGWGSWETPGDGTSPSTSPGAGAGAEARAGAGVVTAPEPPAASPLRAPAAWGPNVGGPGSPLGSVRPPDTTGTATPSPARVPGRGAGTILLAALVGAALGTSGTLALVRTSPAYTGSGATQAPIVAVDRSAMGTVEAVATAVTPSVVRIDILASRPSATNPNLTVGEVVGNGSGVIYRSDGYIITNNHVVEGSDALRVKLASGETLEARIVGTDPFSDLAVLRIDRTGLPAINLRADDPVRVGEQAIAIGSPFGLDASVTSGVVSAINRNIDVPGPSGGAFLIPNVLQTDAAINPGNSGGALVDARGRLIGINTAILSQVNSSAGVGFAIPAETAVSVAEELIATGAVRHAYLGITGGDVTPTVAAEYDLSVDAGVIVDSVQPGTGAAAAGLLDGDIILAFNGRTLRGMEDLSIALRDFDPGDSITLDVLRGDERLTLTVMLGERPTG